MSPTWMVKATSSRSMRSIIRSKIGSSRDLYGASPMIAKVNESGDAAGATQPLKQSETQRTQRTRKNTENTQEMLVVEKLPQPVDQRERILGRELVGPE